MVALLIVGIVFCALALVGFFYYFSKFKKARDLKDFDKKTKTQFIACCLLFTIASVMAGFGIYLLNPSMQPNHIVMMFFGSLIFGVSFFVLVSSFTIYYYKPDLVEHKRKWVRRFTFIAIPFTIIFLVMSLDAYSYYISFPLISGIGFGGDKPIQFLTYDNSHGAAFIINWYGIIILTGAIVAYFIADHKLYKEYKRHGLIDSMFIVAFLFGILGARFWYCAVLEKDITTFFNFQDGGMAIMGGVIFGGAAGIAFMLIFRRYINIRHAIDLIVPGILIAQAIGRWGNFFNHEVYGSLTMNIADVWWLPNFIKQQMAVSFAEPTQMYLPLFIIESVINIAGYFLIVYALGKPLKKHLSFGDLGALYVSWYGLVRVILEPLRQSDFEYNQSWITAWIMFGGGLLAIIGLHVYDYFRWDKHTFKPSLNQFTNPRCPYYIKPQN